MPWPKRARFVSAQPIPSCPRVSLFTTERYDTHTSLLFSRQQDGLSPANLSHPLHKRRPSTRTAKPQQRRKPTLTNSLKDQTVGRLAGRHGFEPRYRGPEATQMMSTVSG